MIYRHQPTNKLYQVSMNGRRIKLEFAAYHRQFKKSEPRVVHFYEVRPVSHTITVYDVITDDFTEPTSNPTP